ncbi:hypothetical protein GCM10009837_40710 [Streptomyces durmitorensis]
MVGDLIAQPLPGSDEGALWEVAHGGDPFVAPQVVARAPAPSGSPAYKVTLFHPRRPVCLSGAHELGERAGAAGDLGRIPVPEGLSVPFHITTLRITWRRPSLLKCR